MTIIFTIITARLSRKKKKRKKNAKKVDCVKGDELINLSKWKERETTIHSRDTDVLVRACVFIPWKDH